MLASFVCVHLYVCTCISRDGSLSEMFLVLLVTLDVSSSLLVTTITPVKETTRLLSP